MKENPKRTIKHKNGKRKSENLMRGSVPGVCVGVVPYLRWTGNSSLVVMTSRAFQPMMETPPNTDERRTTTSSVLSWSGMTQISRELSPDTTRENTARGRGDTRMYVCMYTFYGAAENTRLERLSKDTP